MTVDGGELFDDEKWGIYGGGVRNGLVIRGTVKSDKPGIICGGAIKNASWCRKAPLAMIIAMFFRIVELRGPRSCCTASRFMPTSKHFSSRHARH